MLYRLGCGALLAWKWRHNTRLLFGMRQQSQLIHRHGEEWAQLIQLER
jgi:hypothetical protein